MRVRLIAPLLAVVGVPLVPPPAAAAQNTLEIQEWTVPYEASRPRDPYVGPDGRVWFVGQRSHYAAVLDPGTGEFTRHDLLEGAGPHNLIVDDEGTVWYAGNADAHIGKLDEETGDIERFDMPDERAGDPHTLIFDPDGDIWFTVQNGNFIGHLTRDDGEVRLVEAPMAEGRGGRMGSSRPYGIKLDSNGTPWVVLFNTNKIATVDPATMELTTFDLPDASARPRRLEIDSKDRIWYVDYANGRLGRLDPETGDVTEWANPGGDASRPYGMAIDADDRIWFVETGHQPNTFVGFDPTTEEFFSVTEVGSGGGSIRHMFYDLEHNVVWFGSDANTIGRAELPPLSRRVISE